MMLLMLCIATKHVVHAYESDNGYPSSRDDGNVLFRKANEHQHQEQQK
jgi:hypothetical protein